MAEFLTISNIKKSFGTTEVLKNIHLSINEGEFLVLVGPSGCGKSTLLNLIAGLEELDHGEIYIRDICINNMPPAQRNIAMVFQSYALYPHLTVQQNMAFALEMQGMAKTERNRKVAAVASLLQLEPLLTRKPGALSGGQRQRVAMGRALVREPDVFLFDEPLSNLDAKLRVEMRTLIKRLHQRLKTTTVYVTHDQIEAMTLADRIVVMNEGVVQQIGTPQDIYTQPENTFVAKFMGSPSMNLIEVNVVTTPAGLAVELPLQDKTSVLAMPHIKNLGNYVGKNIILGLRPEVITTPTAMVGQHNALHCFTNLVDVVEPTGADKYLISAIGGSEIISRVPSETQVEAGNLFEFAINIELTLAFDQDTAQRVL